MSTKSKLLAMTENLQFPDEAGSTPIPGPVPAAAGAMAHGSAESSQFPPVGVHGPRMAPRTGPGQMLQFRGQMLATESELGKLKEQVKSFEGAAPTRKLDPQHIEPSRWANRHPDSFSHIAFLRLKQDIEQAGGNVQPILVRPKSDQPERYEIVFGHRRHRACLELGLPVLAMIDTTSLSDQELFSVMDRENRERADLSPHEQGSMYRRALDQGLYLSNRRLAEALGVSHTWVANVLMVADLPLVVLECFSSPLVVQHRHAKVLHAALDQDRKGVLRRAEKLRQQVRKPSPAAVVDALLVAAGGEELSASPRSITVDGKIVGKWSKDKAGRLSILIEPGMAGDDQSADAITQAIARALQA
jgi:ParB family chromosome partitioning protein